MSDYTAEEVEAAVEPLLEEAADWDELEDLLKGSPEWTGGGSGTVYPAVPGHTHIEVNGEQAPIEVVEDHGGGEGSGEARWVVIKVGTQYFKKDGYYASHYGSEFDGDLKEVRKIERMVTFYE